jgi:uncharacterized membrane-anchored protein
VQLNGPFWIILSMRYGTLTVMAARHKAQGTVPQATGGVPKVPSVKPYFWVVKLLTTAMGEAISDFLVNDWNKYGAVVLGFILFVVAIAWQFRTPKYATWPYWTAVSMVAVFGTMAADVMHIALGVPYIMSASFYAVCLIVTFIAWYRSEGTLNIHSITTRRREVFYWLTVIFTFAMGTALGDLFATTFSLGYITSAFVFIGLICVPLVAWRLGVNPVLTFWVAYIITRPIGASFADFFGQPKDISGMGYGHAVVSAVTLVIVVGFCIWMSRTGVDQPEPETAAVGVAGAVGPAGAGQLRWDTRNGYQQQYGQQPPNPFEQQQYGQPTVGRPQYRQQPPNPYGQQQYGQPTVGRPQYGEPTVGRPQYGEQRPEPRQGQPSFQPRPSFQPPGQQQPGYDQYGQQRPPWEQPRPQGQPDDEDRQGYR